jgi:hypothetical protein
MNLSQKSPVSMQPSVAGKPGSLLCLRTAGSHRDGIPQPDGAQFAALAWLDPLLAVPKSEIAFWTSRLPHSGHCNWRSRLAERISFSNL